jgi:predicted glycoside hydrolase/deacetylase ChbG (UPF0249 family)
LAVEYGLAIRAYYEPPFFVAARLGYPNAAAFFHSAQLAIYCPIAHRRLPSAPRPRYFFGQSHIGAIDEKFLAALIEHCPDANCELMCHPGERDETEERELAGLVGETWITTRREPELAALTARNWREYAVARGVKLCAFADL